ncbi:MAG: phosphodiester glycosidase family protein [Oscillospiraceae bacterium]|nr:phosphodiester glycosidase family protein [Oscillospiraceae bacterium]
MVARKKKKKNKSSPWAAFNRVLDRIFIFLFVTGVILVCGGLGVGYIATREEFPSLRDTFVMTMMETRRFHFIPRVFLSQDECSEILSRARGAGGDAGDSALTSDPSLIHRPGQTSQQETAAVPGSEGENPDPDATAEENSDVIDYGYVDEDGDGYILVPVSGRGFNGYMLIVLDPSRCFVARGGEYQTINLIAERTGAIGGINGGAFRDEKGGGSGGNPEGLTIIDGQLIEGARYDREAFVGFDSQGILHVGYYTYSDCLNLDIVGGVSFSPPLIINGERQDTSYIISGVNPRTAIGQRADGAILMLVIDGRQLSSAGAKYDDVTDVMLQFGAVNAMNLDGGSSTVMYLNGELVNSPSSASGQSRGLPNAFLFR